jgi:hypothetical protein
MVAAWTSDAWNLTGWRFARYAAAGRRFNQSTDGRHRMSRWPLAAFAPALTALAVLGCGESTVSSRPLTRAALVARADALCRRLNTKLAANAVGGEGGSLGQLMLSLAAYEHAVAEEMRRLTPPSSMADAWGQMIGGAQTLADGNAKLGAYEQAHGGQIFNPSPTTRAASSAISEGARRLTAAAAREGFTECATLH